MKKDQNLSNKNIYTNNSSGATQITQGINHHTTQVIEVDHPNEELHEISHKIDIIDRIAKKT